MAILNQEPGKIENVFSDISTSIERSISDFDRSHSGSLSKKQASEALSKIYCVMSPVEEFCKKYITFIDILSNGTEEDISSLNIQHDDVDMLNDQISKLDYGIAKLLYTFFIAENSDAWKPHMSTLTTMKNHSINTFIEYKRLTMGLVTLAMQHIPLSYAEPEEFTEEELASFKKSVEDSHKRFGMEAPKWKTA